MTAHLGPVERLLTRDTWIVVAATSLIIVLAAIYTVFGIGMSMSAVEMARPIGEPMMMGRPIDWTWSFAALVFSMWWIMMVAMMIPSASPVLLLFKALKRQSAGFEKASGLSLLFLSGYLLAGTGFSAVETLLQWLTEMTALTNGPMMTIDSKVFAGIVLIAAGAYQFSAQKTACLRHCRSPAQFLSEHNRQGPSGALFMGIHHGIYCLGCCWALMALLFVGGIMNLY